MIDVENWIILGGISINLYARLECTQTYDPIAAATVHRLLSGTARKQTRYRKLSTRISGRGPIPPGLEAIDWSLPQTLACGAPLEITGGGLSYTLPATRRVDSGFTPLAYAYLGADEGWQGTAISLAGDVATLTAVSGASAYRVRWYPLISVYSDGPTHDTDLMDDETRWEISAEEI